MDKFEKTGEAGVQELWEKAEKRGVSRRQFMNLLSAGGTAAVVAAYGIPQAGRAAAKEELVTPSADRLHVKPLPKRWFISHGTSIEMAWEAKATDDSYLMDSGQFFVRNHTATPILNPDEWQVKIDGAGVENPLSLGYEDLLKMPTKTVTRFIECAGNGRALYDKVLGKAGRGTQWTTGGYGIATWTGVPLSHVLDKAGLKDSAVSIMASGLDASGFEKPLPVDKALQDDTLIVIGMNGGPLPYDHGFPARLLVPGWVGSYNVKWLGRLHVGTEQLYSKWNTRSYVLMGPEYPDPDGPPKGEIIREQTVKSVVAASWPGELKAGKQRIVGYAWSPYAAIDKVEVSLDGGKSYKAAELSGPNIAAAGTRWELPIDAEPGEMTITPRAMDAKGNSQPPVADQVWNVKGYVWNAVIPHPVKVSA